MNLNYTREQAIEKYGDSLNLKHWSSDKYHDIQSHFSPEYSKTPKEITLNGVTVGEQINLRPDSVSISDQDGISFVTDDGSLFSLNIDEIIDIIGQADNEKFDVTIFAQDIILRIKVKN